MSQNFFIDLRLELDLPNTRVKNKAAPSRLSFTRSAASSADQQYNKRYNYAHFSISHCFQSTGLESRSEAEKDFKQCISEILEKEVKTTEPIYAWAKTVKQNAFVVHSSIEDSPRMSKRKHARSINEGFYAETEGTVDDDVVSPRKVQKFHWLVGGGNEEEETCAGCSKNEWIVGMSVSQLLKEHRRKVLTLAEDEDLIEVDHMLALNNIYYFPRSRSKGVWKVLPKSIHDQVNNDLHVSEGIQNLPDKAVMMCRKLNKIAQQSPDDLEERLLKEYLYALDDPDLKQFVRCLHRLFLNYEDVSDIEDLQEQQFTDQALMPFIRFVFPNSASFIIDGYGSDDDDDDDDDDEVVGGEVKKPEHKYLTVHTDLAKLGLELKRMLDHLISVDRYAQACTVGILVEAQFTLLLNTDDLLTAIGPYERVLQLKDAAEVRVPIVRVLNHPPYLAEHEGGSWRKRHHADRPSI
ncbi:hypothetical protein BX666DRAFT_2114758 [Dichotomocladium elegans]|nr:hypothetical protein BX666DRAFT_2114758 [Dichotomocladium elegans]